MTFSFDDLYEEFAARRRRLTKRLGALLGGLVEFALLGGLALGVAAAFLGRPWGVLPALAWGAGYFLLERRRQGALAAGDEPETVRRSSDLLAFGLTAALAALGLWVFVGAMIVKDRTGWQKPEEQLPPAIDLTIVK